MARAMEERSELRRRRDETIDHKVAEKLAAIRQWEKKSRPTLEFKQRPVQSQPRFNGNGYRAYDNFHENNNQNANTGYNNRPAGNNSFNH